LPETGDLPSMNVHEVGIIRLQTPRFKPWLKAIAMVVAWIFLSQQVIYSAELRDIIAYNNIRNTSPKIYLIGDVHTHYAVQKQIISHIRALNKESGVNVIFTEGSHGFLDLSDIDMYRDLPGGQEAIEEVAEKYLKEGKIAADEYLRIVEGDKYEIYGVDDMALYDKVFDYFWNPNTTQTERDSLRVNIERERAIIDNLIAEIAKREEKKAIMITGLFHVPGLADKLKRKDILTEELHIHFDGVIDRELYENILERNNTLELTRSGLLKVRAIDERTEWQELQGDVLETALKNAYAQGGTTAVETLVSDLNTLAAGRDIGPFSVATDQTSGAVYVSGKK